MSRKPMAERTLEDMNQREVQLIGKRIFYALGHPDSPVLLLEHEASLLARHIAVRLTRMEGSDDE